jgi:hypothetical protein
MRYKITQGVISLSATKMTAILFEMIKECRDPYLPIEILYSFRRHGDSSTHYICYFNKRPIDDPVAEAVVELIENEKSELQAKYLNLQGIVDVRHKKIRCRYGYPIGVPRVRVPDLFYVIDHTAGRIYSLKELKLPDVFLCGKGIFHNHLLEVIKKSTLIRWIQTEDPRIEDYVVPKEFYKLRFLEAK